MHSEVTDSVHSREERCKEEEGRRLVVELVAVDDSGRLTNEKFLPSPWTSCCACLSSIVRSLQGNSFLHLYVEVILPLTRGIYFSSPCFWVGLVTALVNRLYGMWCYGTSVLNFKKPGSFHSFLEHSCYAGRSPRDVEENRTLSVQPQLSSQPTARVNQPREFSIGMSSSEKPPHCRLETPHRTEKHPMGPKSNHRIGKIIKMLLFLSF